MTDDLLALLVEVSSVTASAKQLKKPLSLPRPTAPKDTAPRPVSRAETDAAYKKGISVLARTSRQVSR